MDKISLNEMWPPENWSKGAKIHFALGVLRLAHFSHIFHFLSSVGAEKRKTIGPNCGIKRQKFKQFYLKVKIVENIFFATPAPPPRPEVWLRACF